jgi:hypothetical protein
MVGSWQGGGCRKRSAVENFKSCSSIRHGELRHGEKLIRHGRPPSGKSKTALTLRLDEDVVEAYRGTGEGWADAHQRRPAPCTKTPDRDGAAQRACGGHRAPQTNEAAGLVAGQQ